MTGCKDLEQPPPTRPDLLCVLKCVHRQVDVSSDPLARLQALTALLAALAQVATYVSDERDLALSAVLSSGSCRSHRALSADLGLSRQRIDQLASKRPDPARPCRGRR